jgi:hypothetical protein
MLRLRPADCNAGWRGMARILASDIDTFQLNLQAP